MADDTTTIKLIIEAQTKVQDALAGLKALDATLKTMTGSQDKTTASANAMAGALKGVLSPLTAMPGPAGQAATRMSSLAESFGTVTSAAGFVAVGVAGIVAGFAALAAASVVAANSIGHYQEEMDIAAERTGLTLGEIGGLTVAASNVGRTFDSIQPALTMFTRHLAEARNGSEQALKTFIELGKAAGADLTDPALKTGEVLKLVATGLENIKDPAERTRVSFELFGRGVAAIAPILSQDLTKAEELAKELGITLSPAMVKVARDADTAGDRLRLSFTGAMNSLTLTIAPLGTAILNLETKWLSFIRAFTEGAKHLSGIGALGLPQFDFSEGNLGTTKGPRDVASPLPAIENALGASKELTAAQKFLAKEAKDAADAARKLELAMLNAAAAAPVFGPSSTQFFENQSLGGQTPEAQRNLALDLQEMAASFSDASIQAASGLMVMNQALDGTDERTRQYVKNLNESNRAGARLTQALVGGLSSAISAAILFGESVSNVFKQLMNTILETLIQVGVKSFLSIIPGIGPLVSKFAHQSGGTFGMMPQPIYAQSGVVMAGLRGVDSVPAMLGRGETVLSHNLTDKLERFLSSGGASGNTYLTINASGHFVDRMSLKEFAQETLVPVVIETLDRRSYRGG